MGSNMLQICFSSHCVRALAPCLMAGCCVVNGLVPRTLLMEFPLFSEVPLSYSYVCIRQDTTSVFC